MDYSQWIRTHGDPPVPTPIEPYRSATVRSDLYSGETVGIPVVVVSRAPAPPSPAEWLCVRPTIGLIGIGSRGSQRIVCSRDDRAGAYTMSRDTVAGHCHPIG